MILNGRHLYVQCPALRCGRGLIRYNHGRINGTANDNNAIQPHQFCGTIDALSELL